MGLERVDDTEWHLTHDPTGGFSGMSWTTAPARQGDFEERHTWLSTSPESGFVQVAMAERRDATRSRCHPRPGPGAHRHERLYRRAAHEQA